MNGMDTYRSLIESLLEECDHAVSQNSDSELPLAEKALKISKENQYDIGIYESHYRIGRYMMFNSKNENALEHFEICYSIAHTLDDSLRVAHATNSLGITYYNLGIVSKSMDLLLESLNISRDKGFLDIECRVYNNICGILDELHDYDTALSFLFDILEKCSCTDSSLFPKCVVLRNIAHTYHNMQKLSDAEYYANLAIRASQDESNPQMLCESYYVLGQIKHSQKLLDEAYNMLIKAQFLAETVNSSFYQVQIRINLSLIFSEKGLTQDAYHMIKEAYGLAIELDSPSLKRNAASNMADICQKIDNKDMLIEALLAYRSVSLLMEEENTRRQHAYAKAQLMLFNLKKDNERLRVEIERDPLTGCLSSRTFPDRITHALTTCGHTGALVFLDIDNLKLVNDSYGHDTGDALLKSFAHDLLRVLPKESIKIRISGDEFLVFLPKAGREEAAEVLEKLLKAIKKPRQVGEINMPIQCSAGVALCPEHSSDIVNLRKMADAAMYSAKQAGRGIFRVFNAS